MNFRKHISIVLASLVLLANLGLSFAVNYCKDEIASVSFQYQEDEPCVEEVKSCCAKEDSHDSCCSNKLIKVEKKTDDILVKTLQLDLEPTVFVAKEKPSCLKFKILKYPISSGFKFLILLSFTSFSPTFILLTIRASGSLML